MKKGILIFLIFVLLIVGIFVLDKYGPEIEAKLSQAQPIAISNKIPEGAIYSVYNADTKTFTDLRDCEFSSQSNDGDVYTYAGIQYNYRIANHSWNYRCYVGERPDNLLAEINGIPVVVSEIEKPKKNEYYDGPANITVADAGEIVYSTVS